MAQSPNTNNQHPRQKPVPQIRLAQPLPPLPPVLPQSISPTSPRIRIAIPEQPLHERYRDSSPEENELPEVRMEGLRDGRRRPTPSQRVTLLSPLTPLRSPFRDMPSPTTPVIEISPAADLESREEEEAPSKPPDYEPMYDYLRSRPINPFTSPNSNTFLSPTSRPQSPVDYMPYSDDVDHPFIITLSPLSPLSRPGEQAPPSYEELYMQHPCPQRQEELAELVRMMDGEGGRAEEICKFVIGMVMLTLCVVGVGLAFNWGRGWGPPPNQGRGW
jgi:hypothetical protein